jgi:6-phosphogluconolactonase
VLVVDDVPAAFSEVVIQAFQARQDEEFCMALAGGQTARLCYERLSDVGAELIDWWAVSIFWADERCVAADHPDSNPMRCDEGPEAYQLRLGEIGKLDFVHLVLGEDGHAASLFPGSSGMEADPGQLVALSEDPSGRHQHKRMTLTLSGLARSRLVVFTVSGAAKRDAMQAILDGADLPAAQVVADRVLWLVDREAAPRGY